MFRIRWGKIVPAKLLTNRELRTPMPEEYQKDLEGSRNDQVRALGFLCYNLYADGAAVCPNMDGMVEEIKKNVTALFAEKQTDRNDNRLYSQEKNLNDQLMALGLLCYNLYVDRKLFHHQVQSLCDSISSINQEIAGRTGTSPETEKERNNSETVNDSSGYEETVAEKKHGTQSKLKVTCPYGMEPIPVHFKQCICGYRNQSEARFCGKCGAKLMEREFKSEIETLMKRTSKS